MNKTKIKNRQISKITFIVIFTLLCMLATLNFAYAQDETSQPAQINISVESSGYSSGTSATLDRTYYASGDSVVLSWSGAKSGSDLIIPTSIRYGNRVITVSDLLEIDCFQSTNSEYKRRMKSSATMTDFTVLQDYVTKSHEVKIENLTVDTNIIVTWSKVVPVYRMYNMITSEHLFTTNKTEYDSFVALGQKDADAWIGEGVSWLAPDSGSKTVHRLYNAGLGMLGSSSHYYTADSEEIENLLNQGWVDDGSQNQFQSGGSAAIYTCYNEALGSAHHYTASKKEWESLSNNGWDLELDKNGTSGVFSGVLATGWTYSPNYYVVEHVINDEVADRQFVSGRAGFLTSATPKKYPGYKSVAIAKTAIDNDNSTVVQITYEAEAYSVTFDGQGKDINVPIQSVNYGEKIADPGVINTVGYIFEGWYFDSECTQAFNFTSFTMPASNVVLYANWSDDLITYKVHHRFQDVNGNYPEVEGDAYQIEEMTGRIGDETQAVAKVVTGFQTSDFVQKTLSRDEDETGGNDVYINYVRRTYEIHFNLTGGSYSGRVGEYGVTFVGYNVVTVSLRYGATIDFSQINKLLKHDSQYFAGWYTSQQYDSEESERWGYADLNDTTMPARQVHLYARWTNEQVWTIFYNTNGGTAVTDEEVKDGETPFSPGEGATTREGYTFEGWYSDANLTRRFNFSNPVNKDTYLYAKWIGNPGIKYVVRHIKQNTDGTWDNAKYEDVEQTGTAGEVAIVEPMQYEGFIASELGTSRIAGDGSTVVELKYSRKSHVVHFDLGGHGQQIEDQVVLYGARVQQPTPAPSATGYTFEGWYKDAACQERYYWVLNEMPDRDMTIYAKWNFLHVYWLGPSSKITTGNGYATSYQANPNYENAETGYIKGEAQIDADVEAIRSGNIRVMQEYRRYMLQDNYHLYVKWGGATDDAQGESNENAYVEFRIVNVGSHTEDGSALTFQAIHMLPHAEQMNKTRTNATSWDGSDLNKKLQEGGEIYNNFESGFIEKIYAVTKDTTNGGKSSEVTSVAQKLWIPSYTEITGKPQTFVSPEYEDWPGFSDDSEVYEGEQYYYFSQKYIDNETINQCLIYRTRAGNSPANLTDNYSFWWLRSPNVRFNNTFLGVYMGNPYQHAYADDYEGVVLAFCF